MIHDDTTDATAGGESGCQRLDAYLDGELRQRDAAAFEVHSAQCAMCAEAVDQQRWINDLLRSAEADEVEAAPAWAIAATSAAMRKRGRRRVAAVAALAAALAAVAAWPRLPLPRREGLGEGRPTVASDSASVAQASVVNPSPNPSLPGRGKIPQPAATFVSSGGAIVVPVASSSAEVTVVQVYPTVDAQWRLQIVAAATALSSEPNGG